jgi:hypothetical protein
MGLGFAVSISCFTLLSAGWAQSSQAESAIHLDGSVVPATSGGIATSVKKREVAGADPVDLVRRATQADKENDRLARLYAFREHHHQWGLDASGRKTGWHSRTWDVIGLEGSTYRKLIMINDQPLPAKRQKHEDKRLRKETERRRSETPAQRKNRLLHYSMVLPFDKFPEIYTLTLLGEETVEGRSAWVIDGIPKPGFQSRTDAEKEAANFHVKIMIDQEEAHFSALELTVTGDHSRLQKGTCARVEWTRLNDGTWMVRRNDITWALRLFRLIALRGRTEDTYSDFQRFQVDSKLITDEP